MRMIAVSEWISLSEHRWVNLAERYSLFSQISRNWQGRPLDSTETMLKYLRTTSTSRGLNVRASMTRRNYPLGVKITDAEMADLEICWHDELPSGTTHCYPPARAS